jgi:hypothetical protein
MTFRQALYQQLQAVAQGVFPDVEVLPLGATPPGPRPDRYLTWNQVSAIHERHLSGGSGLRGGRYDVNTWSRKLSEARQPAGIDRGDGDGDLSRDFPGG